MRRSIVSRHAQRHDKRPIAINAADAQIAAIQTQRTRFDALANEIRMIGRGQLRRLPDALRLDGRRFMLRRLP